MEVETSAVFTQKNIKLSMIIAIFLNSKSCDPLTSCTLAQVKLTATAISPWLRSYGGKARFGQGTPKDPSDPQNWHEWDDVRKA